VKFIACEVLCVAYLNDGPDNMALEPNMTTETAAPQPRVLVCDDSNTERRSLAHFLRGNGFTVDEAINGDAAIVHIKNNSCDLVLLDLNMPGADGFEVLGYLQEHRRALPVILLSGMPLSKIQHKIHALPTHELPPLLIKPIDPHQLLGLVDLQLSGELSSSGEAQEPRNSSTPD
jgi:DNA-binding response OmpR family regulator